MSDDQTQVVSFGSFRLFPKARLLEKHGAPLQIGGRALDILSYLAERPGEVISKRELVDHVWADVNVDEGNLRFQITALRKALGDGGAGARYIVNVPGRGYCFIAPNTPAGNPQATSLPGPASPRPSLPPPIPHLIGRTESIARISAELRGRRFVAIVGPGGIGKTSVAVAVGHREAAAFRDGTLFVDFSALSDVQLVAGAVAFGLGLGASSADPQPGLLAHLRGKRMLLIFDSCEHVLETLAPLVESMISEAPGLRILATSREAFRIENELVHRLFPLECPPLRSELRAEAVLAYPAAKLFIERVAVSSGEFELSNDEAPLVAEICNKLDGIALAIELAAGKVSAYGIRGVASLLNSRFPLVWQGRRTAVPRHQTLNAALGWSYDLLPAAERTTLRRLSVFVGPFTLEAALEVASGEGVSLSETAEAIENLVEKSMMAPPVAGPLRYHLLDTTRAFAAEKLAQSDENDRIARAHASYFIRLLNDIRFDPLGVPTLASFLPHAEHLANIRAALDWSFGPSGDNRVGVTLAAASTQFFLELSLLSECDRRTRQALSCLDGVTTGSRQEMELRAAYGVSTMFTQGNAESVRLAFSRSLELAEKFADPRWQLWLLRGLHIYLTRIGDFRGTLHVGEQAKIIADRLNDPASTLTTEWMLGVAHHLIGNQAQAVELCNSALTQNPASQRLNILRLGYDDRIVALVALARGLWLVGRPKQAADTARYTIGEAERLEQPLTLGISLVWTIYVFLWIGDWPEAERMIDRLIDHATKHWLGPYHAVGIGLRGDLLIRRGEVITGIEHLRRSQAKLYETRHRIMTTVFATALAEGLAEANQIEDALQTIEGALAEFGQDRESFDLPELLRVKGAILEACGRIDEAETFLQRSLAVARRQSALGWELRAALTLGRLWVRTGRGTEARDLLGPLRARYSEGHDSLDVMAANKLLQS